MESMPEPPTSAEASAALTEAEASRARLVERIATPSWFFTSMGAAITTQIATSAVGLGDGDPWVLAIGLAIFVAVATAQLVRFRRLNGVWLGGFASRVVLGTGSGASASYAVALGFAIWAAYEEAWWLVAFCSIAGGAAYALSGRRWMRGYRAEPAVHGRGESVAWLTALSVAAVAGLVLAGDQPLMADLDANVVAPARLKLLTMLTAVSEAEFWTVRDTLQVSDSVLSKHVAALETVDYVKRRKGVHRGRRTTWLSLTPRGREALSAHVAALRALISGID